MMAEADTAGLSNQKRRTRKALLEAAAQLIKSGRKPTFEKVAEEALVSRATAYRYFPGIEPLLLEASLDIAMPGPSLFESDRSSEPVERVLRAQRAVDEMIRANEPALRMMLINALQASLSGEDPASAPARQNRRSGLIEAALEPLYRIDGPAADRLAKALALVIGTEARLVFRDVLQLDDDEAGAVKEWMIRALVEATQRRG
jgi:AcrR family transcriptional regulator